MVRLERATGGALCTQPALNIYMHGGHAETSVDQSRAALKVPNETIELRCMTAWPVYLTGVVLAVRVGDMLAVLPSSHLLEPWLWSVNHTTPP